MKKLIKFKGNILFAVCIFAIVALLTPFLPMAVSAGTITNNPFQVSGGTSGMDYAYQDETLTIKTDTKLTISTADTTDSTIVVEDGTTAYITLKNVNIDVSSKDSVCAFEVGASATANITLADGSENSLTSGANKAGLQVETGATLNINGKGKLTATGAPEHPLSNGGAGIGGSGDNACGTINILDGTVIAYGGVYSAGIGGANSASGGTINISGGTVTATGGDYFTEASLGGAGIGGGANGDGGEIKISGGEVNATGGYNGAGIGGGIRGAGGSIEISDGAVIAKGCEYGGAGIGAGIGGDGGSIKISGGMVTSTGSSNSAGIGGSGGGNAGEIEISGGTIEAIGGGSSAGIGGAVLGRGGNIKISGGTITATGNSGGAGIGGGLSSTGGNIQIWGGTVIAIGDGGTAGIGGDDHNFSTTNPDTNEKGNAFIIATGSNAAHISDQSDKDNWSGVIFEGTSGEVYESPTLYTDAEIPSGSTLNSEEDTSLTISAGVTLTNDGTLINDGTLSGEGSLEGNGLFKTNKLNPNYIADVNNSYISTGSTISITPTINNPTIMGKVFEVIGWNSPITEKEDGDTWSVSDVKDIGNYRIRYTKTTYTDIIKTFTVVEPPSTETEITGFSINGVSASLDTVNHSVLVTLAYDTDVTNLTPTITLSEAATVSPAGSTAQDFTNPVIYKVTAEDGTTTQDWTVTVALESAPPKITQGANQTIETGETVIFTSNADFNSYIDTTISINGVTQLVHTKGYDNEYANAVEGSIILTISGTYIETLPVGTHIISINSEDGSASTNLTVTASSTTVTPTTTPTATPTSAPTSTPTPSEDTPQTGDNLITLLFIALIFISTLGAGTLFIIRISK